MDSRVALFTLIVASLISACDCGGGPEFVLDEGPETDVGIFDVFTDVISDVSADRGYTDISGDAADVSFIDTFDALDILDVEDVSDVIEDISDITKDTDVLEDVSDVRVDVGDISDIKEEKDAETDIIIEDVTPHDILEDVISDVITDGGIAHTTIKECPPSPNNFKKVRFEFSNPDSTSFECKLNNSDYYPCTSPVEIPDETFTDLIEGENNFYVRAMINGEFESEPAGCSWIKDTVPPETTFAVNPDFECKKDATFEVECNEGGCTYEYSLDGSDWMETSSTIGLKDLSDGNHTLRVRAKDMAGNYDDTPLEYTFNTDTTAPDLTILSKPDEYINTDSGTFTFVSTDSTAIFVCSFDQGPFYDCQSPQVFLNLAEGSHEFRIYSKDGCENIGSIFNYTFFVDRTPPESTITSKPASVSNEKSPAFGFGCSEDGMAECRLDGGDYTGCISPVVYNNLSDGEHRFFVRCIDKAGNVDSTPAEYIWNIDTVPPESTITAKPNNPSQFKNATFEFICTENGSADCSLDNSQYTACTSPVTYNNLTDGNHNFRVRCIDEAGNIDSTPATYGWLIDSTPPVTTITEGPQNPTKSTGATFRFSCNESGIIECRLDSQSWAQCTSPRVYINLTNGPHIFSARCTDNAGNVESSPPVYNWIVDTVPPDTSIITYPPSISNSTAAAFTFSSNESGSTYECSLNDGAYSPCLENQQFSNLSEGTNRLCVRATDRAGNTDNTPACYQWTIDITPPDTIILNHPSNPTNQTIASFEFDSNEPGSTFECSLDNSAFTPCTSPKVYTGLGSNIHTFRVRAVDMAGNVDSTPAEYIWEVDTIAPTTTILSKPDNPSNSTTATFTFSSNDPNALYECSLDGSQWISCSSPAVYAGLSEGSHNFRVRGKDQLGNTEQNPPSYNWDIDITPPDTAITGFPPDPTNNPSPEFTFNSNEGGSTFECSYDFGAYFTCGSPHIWGNISEGIRYFSVRARDKAGNIDPTPAQYSFTVDLTEPETYIVNKPTNPTNKTTATFSFYSNESDTSFECKLDGGSFTPCVSPATYNSLSDGNHTFYVRAIDLSGNIDSTPADYEWKIDTVPPDTTILTNPPAITNSKNAGFTFNCSDDTIPCTFECSLDGAAFSLCTSPIQYTNLADGNHTFRVRAIDGAQNTDPTPAQYNWRVDTVPPQAFIDSMPGNPSMSTDATFTFHCNEIATTECSLDGSIYSSCTSPKSYSNLDVGSHTFAVRCIDQANNISLPVQYSWDIMLFKIERVDAPRFFTNFYNRAIKTDSNNIPHIVYGGDNLYHAYLSGTSFVTEVIDNSQGLGEYASLFIDKNDYLHISYYNPTNLSLMYATNSGGVWSKTTVDSGNNVGMYSAIAVDNNGYVHIAYFDNTTYDLKYATNVSGVWVTQVVESQYISGEYCSIAIDSQNNPHIAYYKRGFPVNKGVLQYATKTGGTWNIQTLDDIGDAYYVGLYTSIFIDKNDDIHLSYFDGSSYDLKYIRTNGGIWNSPIVVESAGDVGRYSSLVVDQNGYAHITYYNTNGTLRYANNISGSFVSQLVDNTASVGAFNSLAIDKNGVLHASYYDATNAKLKYAMRITSGNWTNFKYVDTSGSVGQYPSIHLDTLHRPHICYYDAYYNGELKYAYKENGVWNLLTVDNGGVSNYSVGRYCNIKTDNNNKVHISYIDVSRGNIKYITNSSGSWVSENVDNINTVGQYQTSIAIDSNGKIHISYYDSANGGELRYSNNVAGYWVSTVVDDGGAANANVGQYSSIAVDQNGFVHISYYDATNADLKYATNLSGSFITYTVDSAGSVGAYTAIALDSNGYPIISYYDAFPNYNLKVAIYDGTSWSTSVADSNANNVGLYTSISVDSNNKIHIAYYDATSYKVKYATNKYGSWQNFVIDTQGRLGTNGYTTGIFATPTGMVHIIYYDFLMRDLKYATNEN
ncbi:MAG: hypothetical protein ACP5QK_11145 [Myxococcota bacterium]